MNLSPRLIAFALIAAVSVIAVGCGSTDTHEATAPDAPAATQASTGSTAGNASATTVTVELGKPGEFALVPSATTVPAGKVTFDVKNDGLVIHEMVVVKTDKTPAQLTLADGTADETGTVGEAADLQVGASKSMTLDLKPGHYVLLCNLPGHYAGGMFAEITVT